MNTHTTWRTSSFSAPNNDCVELAHSVSETHIRDTKHRSGGTLRFHAAAFVAFCGIIKDEPQTDQV